MTMAIACPQCFANWGFRQVIAKRADLPDAACPRCAQVGPLIDTEKLAEAIQVFFVRGSFVAETMAPVYQVNSSNPDPARFDSTLDADARLACALTGEVIFDYGPPLWRVGEVDLKCAFDEGGDGREAAACGFVAGAPRVELPVGTRLFRIRKNPKLDETIATPAAFDPPPSHIERSAGRWDDGGTSVLYASDDIELCCHECRVLITDEIVVATLSAARPLVLLDLTAEFALVRVTPFEDPNIFARFLSLSRHERWLDHARTVARAARAAGLDGIRYTSYYAQAKQQTEALNVALFGRPLEAGDLVIESVNRLRLTDARYAFSFGPVLYRDSEMQAELDGVTARVEANLATPFPAPGEPRD
jgi:hypothetical protein